MIRAAAVSTALLMFSAAAPAQEQGAAVSKAARTRSDAAVQRPAQDTASPELVRERNDVVVGQSGKEGARATRVRQREEAVAAKPLQRTLVMHPTVERYFVDARKAELSGNFSAALTSWKLAEGEAKTRGANEVQAEAAFKSAVMLEQLTTVRPSPAEKPARLLEAAQAYETAIAIGAPAQQQRARNNLAVLRLKQGRAGDAVRVFRETDFRTLGRQEAPVFRYNYGRALETAGEPGAALVQYQNAVMSGSSMPEVTEAFFRAAARAEPAPVETVAQTVDFLIDRNQAASVEQPVRALLRRWGTLPDAQRILAPLVRCYAAARLGPEDFRAREYGLLGALGSRNPSLAGAVRDIVRAFQFDMPGVTGGQYPAFIDWQRTDWQRKAFSELLAALASQQPDSPDRAMRAYYAAWRIDGRNTGAALSAISAAPAGAPETHAMLQQMVTAFFASKGGAYAERDDQTVLRMHTLLGAIFEKERRWGDDIFGATWHWRGAIDAERRMQAKDPSLPPSPGIYEHMAECMRRAGQEQVSFDNLILAGQAYVQNRRPESADAVVRKASGLGVANSRSNQNKLAMLSQAVARQ